jgi:hypothetical protein
MQHMALGTLQLLLLIHQVMVATMALTQAMRLTMGSRQPTQQAHTRLQMLNNLLHQAKSKKMRRVYHRLPHLHRKI